MGLPIKIGIIGYGNLGKFLVQKILKDKDFELVFVWNRTSSQVEREIDSTYVLKNLDDINKKCVDLIVEVSHPCISDQYGEKCLSIADYMIGSPTALCDANLEAKLRRAATRNGLYVPSGAFWGGEDIGKMADRGTLASLKVTMKKHPSAFKLHGTLKENNDNIKDKATVLYNGPVRELCPLAPNNVNTMAVAAISAHTLGFDNVIGCLISDPNLNNWHVVEIDVGGHTDPSTGNKFQVNTVRSNPAHPGAVTGSATYTSFYSSIKAAHGKGPGVHLC